MLRHIPPEERLRLHFGLHGQLGYVGFPRNELLGRRLKLIDSLSGSFSKFPDSQPVRFWSEVANSCGFPEKPEELRLFLSQIAHEAHIRFPRVVEGLTCFPTTGALDEPLERRFRAVKKKLHRDSRGRVRKGTYALISDTPFHGDRFHEELRQVICAERKKRTVELEFEDQPFQPWKEFFAKELCAFCALELWFDPGKVCGSELLKMIRWREQHQALAHRMRDRAQALDLREGLRRWPHDVHILYRGAAHEPELTRQLRALGVPFSCERRSHAAFEARPFFLIVDLPDQNSPQGREHLLRLLFEQVLGTLGGLTWWHPYAIAKLKGSSLEEWFGTVFCPEVTDRDNGFSARIRRTQDWFESRRSEWKGSTDHLDIDSESLLS